MDTSPLQIYLPDNSDTDADGLTAHEELTKYSTDPDKADTTGDGFRDGFLVSEGFNPTTDYSALVNYIKTEPTAHGLLSDIVQDESLDWVEWLWNRQGHSIS